MQVHQVDHPLLAHKLTALRDVRTDSPTFRRLVDELVTLLAYEATRDIAVAPSTVRTPVATARGVRLTTPLPVVVPVLRAGLGMLDGMTRLLPTAEVGFLGLVRDESTLEATTYADRVPERLDGRTVFLLDPMLATGGTLATAVDVLQQRGAARVVCVCLLCAPEGLRRLGEQVGRAGDVRVVTAAVDDGLTSRGWITPGLGDAGDRLYGVPA